MKAGFWEKLMEKVERVEPGEVQAYLGRLMQEKGFLEKVFDALQEGAIVFDADGVITYLNRAACGFFGLERSEAIGRDIGHRIPGVAWHDLVSRRTVISRDLEVSYPENRFLNFYLTPIEDEKISDHVIGYVMLIRDITQHREVEKKKIESETLNVLTMLAAGVAHEIGNPLNSLTIHLQLAERKLRKAPPALREDLTDLLGIAQGEIKRLDFIIGNFLTAVRPSTPRLKPCDLNRLVQESIRVLEPEIRDRDIDIRLELSDRVPPLQLDGDQIKQAFYNLIRNASQAVGSEGSLLIRSDVNDDSVIVQFIDSGAGISSEDMANVFEPYFTTKKKGSGLGLFIVRRILREHGGEIEFESTPGKGTTVSCFFPRHEKRVRLLETAEMRQKKDEPEVIDIDIQS